MSVKVKPHRPLLLRVLEWSAVVLCCTGWLMIACVLGHVGGNLPAQIFLSAHVSAFVLGLASLTRSGALAAGLAALTLSGWLVWVNSFPH